MKLRTSMKKDIAKVWQLWRLGQYDRALAEVERLLETRHDNSQLLVMRSQLIRLQDREDKDATPTLDDAKADLELAVELDEQSPVALLEMGYFLYAIEDDAKAASQYFQKAIVECQQLLREALLGQAGALEEQGRESAARDCLVRAYILHPINGKTSKFPTNEDIVERLNDLHA